MPAGAGPAGEGASTLATWSRQVVVVALAMLLLEFGS
jgi:hypothetical protein